MKLYPLKLIPEYVEKIWGGRNLERLFGRDLPEGSLIGESWEICDLKEKSSVVANGLLAGRTLSQVIEDFGDDLLGKDLNATTDRFPLLLKILDANDTLSMQVHPDDVAAHDIGCEAESKTECWYIIESRNGFIYKDLDGDVSVEDFATAVKNDSTEELVQKIDCKTGDFYHLPAGTVHALGKGLVVAEIQTPSNTTFRVSDWGRGREVHVEESLKSIHFDRQDPDYIIKNEDKPGHLVSSPYFEVSLKNGIDNSEITKIDSQCECLMILNGNGTIKIPDDASFSETFQSGDTILIPSSLDGYIISIENDTQWLEVTIPDNG